MASPSRELPSPDATPLESPHSDLEEEAFSELDKLSLKEILDQDSRPTFVLDLDPDYSIGHAIRPIFCNAALRLHDRLLDSVTGASDGNLVGEGIENTSYDDFRIWATGVSRHNDSKELFPLTILYQALLWTGFTVRQRWRIISGNALFQSSDIPSGSLRSAPSSKFRLPGRNAKRSVPVKELVTATTLALDIAITGTTQPSESTSASVSKITSSKTTSKETSRSGASYVTDTGKPPRTTTDSVY